MEKTNRELLIRDICSRLPYGVFVKFRQYTEPLLISIKDALAFSNGGEMLDDIQYLYLRPMSSMTDEEKQSILRAWNIKASFVGSMCDAIVSDNTWWGGKDKSEPLGFDSIPFKYMSAVIDWLNAHHFDYRGLIEKELALEAPEHMYD